MTIFIAIILGLIQGLCEFLPISSSGHLMIFESLLGVSADNEFFNVTLHLATLLSVIIVFRKQIWQVLTHPTKPLFWQLIISTAITCIIVVIIKLTISELFEVSFLGFGFLFSATLILVVSKFKNKTNYANELYTIDAKTAKLNLNCRQDLLATNNGITIKNSILVGCFQGLAALPGISRSASSICAAQIGGASRESALEYSFLLSIPIIIASMVYELVTAKFTLPHIDFWPLFIGSVTAFISSLLSIKFMMGLAKKRSWTGFAIYLFILATAILVFTFFF